MKVKMKIRKVTKEPIPKLSYDDCSIWDILSITKHKLLYDDGVFHVINERDNDVLITHSMDTVLEFLFPIWYDVTEEVYSERNDGGE